MLAAIRREIELVEPPVGRVFHTLLSKFEPEEIATDVQHEDARIRKDGKVVKFFIVFPNDAEAKAHTTGRPGYFLLEQDFVVTGFVQVMKEGGPELVLHDDFEAIIGRLSARRRLLDTAGNETEAANLGSFALSGIDRIKVGETLCHFRTLRFTVQERRLAN